MALSMHLGVFSIGFSMHYQWMQRVVFNRVFNELSMDVCGCFQKGFQGIIDESRGLFPNDSTGNSQRV